MTHYIFLPTEVKLDEKGLPTRIQLFRTGTFYDDRYGTIEITAATLQSIVRNFKDKTRGVDLAIDFSHDAGGKAAGWMKDVSLEENGTQVWAEVTWTDSGAEALRSKEFRYISPDFTFDYSDNETLKKFGPTLMGAALTNRPVIKNMSPAVQLTEDKEMTEAMMAKDEEIKMLKEKLASLGEQKPEEKMTEEKGQDQDLLKKISELQASNAELGQKVKAYEEQIALAEKSKGFDVMLAEGKVCEAQRDAFLKGDMMAFAKAAKAVKLDEAGESTPAKVEDESKSAQDLVLEKAQALVKEKGVTLSAAIHSVLMSETELAEKYTKETSV